MWNIKKSEIQKALYGIEAHYETLTWVFMLIWIWLGFAIWVTIDVVLFTIGYSSIKFLGSLVPLLMMIPIVFFPGYWLYLAGKYSHYITKRKTREILESGKKIEKLEKVSGEKKQNIDDILILSTKLHRHIWNNLYLARFKKNKDIRAYLSNLIEKTIKILIDLRNDLIQRIEEKRETLSQSKQQLDELNSWNPDLQVWVASQKARIDIQIWQFEKLQKVLVLK